MDDAERKHEIEAIGQLFHMILELRTDLRELAPRNQLLAALSKTMDAIYEHPVRDIATQGRIVRPLPEPLVPPE